MDFSNAILITSTQYMSLVSPKFQGQTRIDLTGQYKMYWLSKDKLYYTLNTL